MESPLITTHSAHLPANRTKDHAARVAEDHTGSSPGIWDEAASSYDEHRSGDPVYLLCVRAVVRASFRGKAGGTVLDTGCGTGLTTLSLFEHFHDVVAVDFSLGSLERLRTKPGAKAVRLVQADIRRLPFPDESFDAVVCANTLQHLRPGRPQQQAVEELLRVARVNAPVVVSVHHYSRAKRRRGWIKEGKPGQPGIDYIFRFSRSELKALLPGARISGIGFGRWFDRLARVPVAGRMLQAFVARASGPCAAKLGYGHMLLAIRRK